MLLAVGTVDRADRCGGPTVPPQHHQTNLAPVVWIAIPAAVTIVSLAGIVSGLVLNHRPLAYATFIGLTLGGVPLLLRQLPKWTPEQKGVVFGFMAMGGLAILENAGGFATSGWVMAALAGMLGGALHRFCPGFPEGLSCCCSGTSGDSQRNRRVQRRHQTGQLGRPDAPLQTLLPFGVGFALGIAVTAVIMRTLLHKHESTPGSCSGCSWGRCLAFGRSELGSPQKLAM